MGPVNCDYKDDIQQQLPNTFAKANLSFSLLSAEREIQSKDCSIPVFIQPKEREQLTGKKASAHAVGSIAAVIFARASLQERCARRHQKTSTTNQQQSKIVILLTQRARWLKLNTLLVNKCAALVCLSKEEEQAAEFCRMDFLIPATSARASLIGKSC